MTDEPRTYTLATQVKAYARAIIETFQDNFDHLNESEIAYVFSGQELKLRGRSCWAICSIPNAQGQDKYIYLWALEHMFGFIPDVMIIVDLIAWEEMAPEQRVAMMYHELRHIYQKESSRGPCFSKETGKPILILKDHEIGEFIDVVEKFGKWDFSLTLMHEAIEKGERFHGMQELVERAERYCQEGT